MAETVMGGALEKEASDQLQRRVADAQAALQRVRDNLGPLKRGPIGDDFDLDLALSLMESAQISLSDVRKHIASRTKKPERSERSGNGPQQ